jgi:3-hydroxyacyl-CoA dehydrogenase/enoyl-CoA hydratase/3-hydroxybutyryl-CoA epimerase
MNKAWTLEIDHDRIAWLTFDCPDQKVNTFGAAVLSELDSMIEQIGTNRGIRAVVIRSGKESSFIAGADIHELAQIKTTDDAAEKANAGHETFAKLAALPVPTIAVIHGPCLGGGLEMALACSHRIVTDDDRTRLGLPEVGLGIIPGWGGTQRLPRLIALDQSLTMILTGKPISSRKAHRIGLADAIVARAFVEAGVRAFVQKQLAKKRVVRRRAKESMMMRLLTSTAPGRMLVYRSAAKQVRERTKGHYPAPIEALEVVRRTYRRRSLDEGLAIEREAFAKLAITSISRNLVFLFQASQRLKKSGHDGAQTALPRPGTAGVVGAGAMGGGIAWALSRAGMAVRMKDIAWDALGRGMSSAARMFRSAVKRRRMTESEMSLAMHRIAPTLEYIGFEKLDIVIEAVVEDIDIKRKVLADIEENVSPSTIICTNTSSLPLQQLASALRRPEQFVGLHFFNPVNRMPLVEVVPCNESSQQTVHGAVELVRRLGKTPIIVGDCPGFLVNRILLPYLIESAWMFEEGIDAPRIDGLLEAFGMPMGPLALVDEVGIDVGYKVARVLEDAYGERMHVPTGLGAVAQEGGDLGRKSGRGFYVYNNGHRKPNRSAAKIVEKARGRDGVKPGELNDDAIVDRAVLIMVNEAARCLEDQVIDTPESLDMAMVMGTGFAPFRGGLLRYADDRGVGVINERLQELARRYGDRFRPAGMIQNLAREGGRFYKEVG